MVVVILEPGQQQTSFLSSKKEDEGHCRTASLTAIPGRMMETVPKHTKEEKVTGNSQH